MKFIKDFIIQLTVALFVTVAAPVLTGIFTDNAVVLAVVSVVAVAVLIGVFILVYKASRDPSRYEMVRKNITKNRYSIIVVDDEFGNRRARIEDSFRRYFHDYDILLLKSVNDIRLLEAFDIVILDYLGASDNRGDTDDIFKDIFKLYPEKYVVVMSQNSSKCKEICDRKNANSFLPKPVEDGKVVVVEWEKLLQSEIDKAFKELDDPESYWSVIQERSSTDQDRKHAQERYVDFLKKHSNFRIRKFFLIK